MASERTRTALSTAAVLVFLAGAPSRADDTSPAAAPESSSKLEQAIDLQRAGKWDQAIAAFETLRKEPAEPLEAAKILVELGETYFSKGKAAVEGELTGVDPDPLFDTAAKLFAEAVERFPKIEDPVAYGAYMIGSCHLMIGDMKKAADAYKKAYFDYQSTKWGQKALVRLGVALGAQGNADTAIRLLRAHLRHQADEGDAETEGEKIRDYISQLDLVGKPAPSIHADAWMHRTIEKVEDLRGEVVVVVFFATWCHICSRHMPQLKRQMAKWQEKGVVFVGVANPNDPKSTEPVDVYVKSKDVPFFDVAFDRQQASWRSYRVSGLPAVAVIDRDGIVRWRGHLAFLGNTLLESLTSE